MLRSLSLLESLFSRRSRITESVQCSFACRVVQLLSLFSFLPFPRVEYQRRRYLRTHFNVCVCARISISNNNGLFTFLQKRNVLFSTTIKSWKNSTAESSPPSLRRRAPGVSLRHTHRRSSFLLSCTFILLLFSFLLEKILDGQRNHHQQEATARRTAAARCAQDRRHSLPEMDLLRRASLRPLQSIQYRQRL